MIKTTAESDIEENGLVLSNVTEDFSESVASGFVISQYPSEGSLVQKGDKVDIVISNGPKVK